MMLLVEIFPSFHTWCKLAMLISQRPSNQFCADWALNCKVGKSYRSYWLLNQLRFAPECKVYRGGNCHCWVQANSATCEDGSHGPLVLSKLINCCGNGVFLSMTGSLYSYSLEVILHWTLLLGSRRWCFCGRGRRGDLFSFLYWLLKDCWDIRSRAFTWPALPDEFQEQNKGVEKAEWRQHRRLRVPGLTVHKFLHHLHHSHCKSTQGSYEFFSHCVLINTQYSLFSVL